MQHLAIIDCPEHLLGRLSPPQVDPASPEIGRDGSAIIKGVELPSHVTDELRRQGIPLGWYNAGELQDAVLACAYDRTLIDDSNGIHFRDQLSLSDREKPHGNALFEGSRHRAPVRKDAAPELYGWVRKEAERNEADGNHNELSAFAS